MNISLLQMDLIWQSPEANIKCAEKLIDNLGETDLIILPEMFSTGFCMSPKDVAEEANGNSFKWMQNIAQDKDAAIAASIATEENGKYFNRFYFVYPDGQYITYDKRHLFTFAGEQKEYAAGEERIIVDYKGVRILLQICYDLRFPVFARNKQDYDMIIYVANWPVPRIDAWNTLIRARAIENVCYVAAVNRVGNDPYCQYNGGTVLLNYIGKEIVSAEFGKEEAVNGEINMEELKAFRKKFPALNDADQFNMIL